MKRYRKPTLAQVDMMTVKQHNWLLRTSPFMYQRWQEIGARLIRAMLAAGH